MDDPRNFTVWRTSAPGGETLVRKFKWKWVATLYAWEHTRRGWFRYRVKTDDRH